MTDAKELKEYRVCEGGAWINGSFYNGGAGVVLNAKQAKYLLMDRTITDPTKK